MKNIITFPNDFILQPYGSEASGIKAFAIGKNFIIVEFNDGRIYLYNEQFPGKNHVKEMKDRAKKGVKLGTYINQNVRDNYIAYWDKAAKEFRPNKKFN